MRLGVISDLHSNIRALDAVLRALEAEGVDHLVVLGDLFGYYPWAGRAWERLLSAPWPVALIKGNHDEMLLRLASGSEMPVPGRYAEAIASNLEDLRDTGAIEALRELAFTRALELGGRVIRLAHGTPDDPENGRFYPDDASMPAWLPRQGEWLLLGHTHYPLSRETAHGGFLLNPGSVGQPRDGDPRAAFATMDTQTGSCSLLRADYDFTAAQEELRAMRWDDRAIRALAKRHAGSLENSFPSSS